ncbi:MAG: YbaK/EbsC family protein [Burkholderiaceae bacterium]
MSSNKMRSTDRVAQAAESLGLSIEIRTMPDSTRTAAEAASACACTIGQIVKSLVFEYGPARDLVLLLIAGDRSADLDLVQRLLGAAPTRADPKRVRASTGFAIGGVAPIGHLQPLRVFMDPALLEHDLVWAAAGAPNAVFSIAPRRLRDATAASLLAASD